MFRFRPFRHYDEVRAEMEEAGLVFLLPHQMDLLPDDCADLFINISSLHEMRKDQIDFYFRILRRVTGRYAYLKQWIESRIPNKDAIIREEDYPIPETWRRIYWRPCKVQTQFFEALFEVADTGR